MFENVSIIGCGLIGSSVFRALKKNGLAKTVITFDNNKSVSEIIKKENISKVETYSINMELNYHLYQLLEDTSYLETAHEQVQEKASAMDDGETFLTYPIPKAIVEEWEKLNP